MITHKFKCIICGGDPFGEPLITFNNIPASAQDIPNLSEIQFEHGINLELFQCRTCGLVQFNCDPVQYYRDVIRAGGYTSTMKDIRREQYTQLINKYNLKGKKIIEVGTGRGEFLSILNEFDVDAFGIEHSDEFVTIGVKSGLNITRGFVDSPDYIIPYGPFDAFLSFNFLEHLPDPNSMLKGIYNNLKEGGIGLVTVPSFEYIIDHDGFYEFIRDHLVYYTEDSLKYLMQKNGFEVIQCSIINRDTLSIIVRKRIGLDLSKLKSNFAHLKLELNKYIDSFIENNQKVAIWGASHQGFTIISTTDIANKISYIIDSAPFKQNKYAPASHVLIVSPEYYFQNPVDCIIIVAPGYSEEIISIIRKRYNADVAVAILKSNQLEFSKV